MKLHEHPDFAQAVIRAAEHFRARGMRPAIVEKDYYVTEALRAIATAGGNRVIFKGGTSLSKGWSIIERFSEDIDLFLDHSDEYDLILADYDRVSRAFFPQHYFKPKDMRFRHSDAIFPRADLAAALAKDYETQCAQLCFGRFPTWNEVRATFESMRDIL